MSVFKTFGRVENIMFHFEDLNFVHQWNNCLVCMLFCDHNRRVFCALPFHHHNHNQQYLSKYHIILQHFNGCLHCFIFHIGAPIRAAAPCCSTVYRLVLGATRCPIIKQLTPPTRQLVTRGNISMPLLDLHISCSLKYSLYSNFTIIF